MDQETFDGYCRLLNTSDKETLSLLCKMLNITHACDGGPLTKYDTVFLYQKTIAKVLYKISEKEGLNGVETISINDYFGGTFVVIYLKQSDLTFGIWI